MNRLHRPGVILFVIIGLNTVLVGGVIRAFSVRQTESGNVLCVVPPGEPTGSFTACDEVFTEIQAAVDTAVGGEEIWVATGVYTGVQMRNGVTQLVYLDKDVIIRGGYAPPFDTPPDPAANPTILDAQQQGRVVYVVTDTVATLVNLDITGGNASGLGGRSNNSRSSDGNAFGVTVTPFVIRTSLSDCPNRDVRATIFHSSLCAPGHVVSSAKTDSRAGYSVGWGGGIFGVSVTVIISHSFIYSNIAENVPDVFGSVAGFGGGLAFRDSHVTLLNNIIHHNIASREGQGVGGGVGIENGTFYLEHNWVLSNTALITTSYGAVVGYGGGLAVGNSQGEFHNNQIAHNIATENGGGGWGGGIYLEQGSFSSGTVDILLNANQIERNVSLVQPSPDATNSFGEGGGVLLYSWEGVSQTPVVTMVHNLIQNNTGALTAESGLAGGLFIIGRSYPLTFTFEHNDVVGNVALVQAQGEYQSALVGGLVVSGVSAHLENNRFISNTAVISGNYGAAAALYVGEGQFTQRNDIVRGNVGNASGAGGSSIIFDLTQARLTNVVIADNGDDDEGEAIFIGGSDVTLLQPTIARNRGDRALYVEDPEAFFAYGPSILTVTNAVLVSHTVGLEVRDGNTAVVDGILWYNTPIAVSSGPEAVVTVNNQIIGDPKFAADGYHITAGSAAIQMGVPAGVTLDIDGEGRPLLTPSLGVDEYWPYKQYLPFLRH